MKLSKKYLIWTIIFSLLAIAINAYIIVHSCLDAIKSTEASNGVVEITEDIVNTVAPGTITPENHETFASFVRKAFGHFGLFAISGFLSSLAIYLAISPFNKQKYYQIIIIALSFGLLMGFITETIQIFVPGRSGELTDVLIDFSGYLFGFLIILLILLLIIRHIHKEQAKQELIAH